MTFQEMAAALEALSEISVRIRKPGDWYVSQNVDIKKGSMLVGDYGNGTTPEIAIIDHWRALTDLPPDEYLVVRGPERIAVRWNGFMWQRVTEKVSP